jgi:hypothetical protein
LSRHLVLQLIVWRHESLHHVPLLLTLVQNPSVLNYDAAMPRCIIVKFTDTQVYMLHFSELAGVMKLHHSKS